MTKLMNDYQTIEGAIQYVEQGIQDGTVPPVAGRKGLAELRAESARLFALMCK